jgi:6-phosphogluconolactonase (cycloisomerase 2 family)
LSSPALGPAAVAHALLLSLDGLQQDGLGGVTGLRGAVAVAMSPDGVHLYAAASADQALVVFRRDALTGGLVFVESQIDGRNGVTGLRGLVGTSAVAVSPDGGHVYAASAVDGALAVFRREPTTGRLTFVEAQSNGVGGASGLAGAWGVAVAPDGTHVYVASSREQAVAAFARDAVSGALTFVEAQINGTGGITGLDDP